MLTNLFCNMEIKNIKNYAIVIFPLISFFYIFFFNHYQYQDILAGDFLFYTHTNHQFNTVVNTITPGLDSMNIAFNYFPIYVVNVFIFKNLGVPIDILFKLNFAIFSLINFLSARYLFRNNINKNTYSLIYALNPLTFFYFFYYNFWVNLVYCLLPITIKLVNKFFTDGSDRLIYIKLIILFLFFNYGITNPGYFISSLIFINILSLKHFTLCKKFFLKIITLNILIILLTLKTTLIMFLALTELDTAVYLNQNKDFISGHTVDYLSTAFFAEKNHFIFKHAYLYAFWIPLVFYFLKSFNSFNYYHFIYIIFFVLTTKLVLIINIEIILDIFNNLILGTIRNYQKTNLFLPILFLMCIGKQNFKFIKYYFYLFLITGLLYSGVGEEHFIETPKEYKELREINFQNDQHNSMVAIFPIKYSSSTWERFEWGANGYNFISNYINAPFISYFYPYLEYKQKINSLNILNIFDNFNINYVLFHKDKVIPFSESNEQLSIFEEGVVQGKFIKIKDNLYYDVYKVNYD